MNSLIHSLTSRSGKIIEHLEARLAAPPPGRNLQFQMAHEGSKHSNLATPTDARQASVLILLYPRANNWNVVFIKRAVNKKGDRHSGQISFPGGKKEKTDQSLAHTALRETEEEIGVKQEKVHLLGNLTELYIPVSNFEVHPFIGYVKQEPTFTPQETEVASIIESPLQHLVAPDIRQKIQLEVANKVTLCDVPCFKLGNHIVWGATAMMLNEFLYIVTSEAPDRRVF